VERARFDQLRQALDRAEQRVDELAGWSSQKPLDVRLKRFEPVQQVAARIEIAGPERLLPRVRGGVDVRGDGSTEAYVGRVRRRTVTQGRDETSIEALRRVLEEKRNG
jgi:hypothetical protein